MKYLLCVCALWLGALVGYGQSRYLIDLSGQSFDNPLKAGRISTVLDARPDRTSIGWVQVGLANVQTPADLKDGLVPALQRVLASPADASGTYALRVHRLNVGEITTNSSEIGSVELVVDLLRPRPDGQFDLLGRAAQAVDSKGLDVTGKHPANIVAALRGCLQQFEAAGPATLPAVAVLTAEQAGAPVEPLLPLTPYPLQSAAVRRAGVYPTFDDFRRNEPGGTRVAILSKTPNTKAGWEGTSEVEVSYLDEEGKGYTTPVRNVWGYCDGQDLYILYRRHYYQLRPENGGFAFDAPSTADPEAVLAGGLLGGVVGIGIASAMTSGQRQEHHLSLLTGRVTTTPLRGNAAAAARAEDDGQEGQVVVYRRKPGAAVVDVYAGKRVAGGLTPEQGSVKVYWSDRRNALRLCLRPAGEAAPGTEACVETLPRPGETLYFEYVEGPGAPQLKPVPAKEGIFEARRADQRARQSSKQ